VHEEEDRSAQLKEIRAVGLKVASGAKEDHAARLSVQPPSCQLRPADGTEEY
jgi:hypothetical protein